MKKYIVNSSERKLYDENGNVRVETRAKTVIHKTDDEDSFYMVFVNYINWIFEIKSLTTIKVLYKLLPTAEFNTGVINITTGTRDEIMEELKISRPAITKAINELVEKDALQACYLVNNETGEIIKQVKGQYKVNPIMFWKGELSKRKELKVTFESECIEPIKEKSENEKNEI